MGSGLLRLETDGIERFDMLRKRPSQQTREDEPGLAKAARVGGANESNQSGGSDSGSVTELSSGVA